MGFVNLIQSFETISIYFDHGWVKKLDIRRIEIERCQIYKKTAQASSPKGKTNCLDIMEAQKSKESKFYSYLFNNTTNLFRQGLAVIRSSMGM